MKQRKQFPLELRPKTLKDFLADEFGSCSSSGFKSFPRTLHSDSCLPNLSEPSSISKFFTSNASNNSTKVPRSRSISAFQAMINAVKNIHFSTVKSPSILPRSLSRRLSKRRLQRGNTEIIKSKVVTVKDIIRWRSFRDIVEEKQEHSQPSDYTTTTTTTTVSTVTTPSSSNASSWCDSDFTSEHLPEEYIEIEDAKKYLPCFGAGFIETIKNYNDHDSKVDEEEELQSPVSVIDFELFEDEEESTSSFEQALDNVERSKDMLMEKMRRFESLANEFEHYNSDKCMSMDSSSEQDDDEGKETGRSCKLEDDQVEEKAWQLLNHLKMISLTPLTDVDELLILDFLRDELCANKDGNINIRNGNMVEFYGGILDRAEGWMKRESSLLVGLKEKYSKGGCLEEMNKGGMWSNFGEEKQELSLVIECDVVDELVDEILVDLVFC